jgi:hypothetical protein
MISNGFTIGMIGFLLCFLASRIVSTQASKRLDAEVRHRIYDAFASQNTLRTIIAVVICIGYFAAISYLRSYTTIISTTFIVLFLAYLIVNLFITNQRLHSVAAPTDYINSIMMSWILYFVGFLALIAVSFLV